MAHAFGHSRMRSQPEDFPDLPHALRRLDKRMAKLEQDLALPLRQMINPVQLGLGTAVACLGTALALGHLAALL